MRLKRPKAKTVLLLLLALFIAGVSVGAFIRHQVGPYCELTVTELSVKDGTGNVRLSYRERTTMGTWVGERTVSGSKSRLTGVGGSDAGWLNPLWPVPMSSDGSFTVTMGTADDSPEVLRRRFKVKEGETYLIRVGQPLTIYSFEDSRGRRHEKIFEIVPAEQRPSFKDLMAHPDMDGD